MSNRNVQDRNWWIEGDPLLCDDEESISQALTDAVTILSRIGGGFQIVAQRKEVSPGNWQNTGFICQWVSFVPGERYSEPDEQADVVEPVPAAA